MDAKTTWPGSALPRRRRGSEHAGGLRRQQRSPWRPWPFVAAAVALFLLALANIAIEERLSATMLPAPMPPPPPDASPPVLEELGAGALSRLLVFPARASPASPQSFIRLRLEMGRSNS